VRRLPADAAARCLFVRNLNDSGPGSFREAVAARGPRINVFQVGGMLTLQSPIRITEPFVTIADQTAPGTGICFHGSEVSVPTISCSSAGTRWWPQAMDCCRQALRSSGGSHHHRGRRAARRPGWRRLRGSTARCGRRKTYARNARARRPDHRFATRCWRVARIPRRPRPR
jgi:hypothetical protein